MECRQWKTGLVRFQRETKTLSSNGLALITGGQKNLAVYFPLDESLCETELKSNRLISLVEEISR